MQTYKDYEFEVSLSDERFMDKTIGDAMIGSTKNYHNRVIRKEYGYKASRGISFRRTFVTCQSLLEAIESGASFSPLFDTSKTLTKSGNWGCYTIKQRKDGSFPSSFKCNETFLGSYVIGVDIDKTRFKNVEDFVSCLSLQPSIYYTTYSNLQPDKGARFRLIYVLDEMIDNIYLFRYMATNLNKIIEEDTCEFIFDDCNLKCTQYFNGTCKDNKDIIYSSNNSDIIYSFNDMGYSKNGFIDYLVRYCDYRTTDYYHIDHISNLLYNLTNKKYYFKNRKFYLDEKVRDINEETINDIFDESSTHSSSINPETEKETHPEIKDIYWCWDNLNEEQFLKSRTWNKLRNDTKYIYRVEKDEWINGIYQFVDEDYFKLPYITKTKHDGEKRRKTLFQRMCLRKLIKPAITYEELLTGTIIDILRFFDRDREHGDVLSSDFIKRNIERCIDLSIDEIRNKYSNSIEWLMKNTRPKRGKIYFNKASHSKRNTFIILDDLYDIHLSVKENFDNLNDNLKFRISKSLIYEYLKDRHIRPVVKGRMTDEDAYCLIDVDLSIRKNIQFFKDNGLTLSEGRLRKLLKQKKAESLTRSSSINPETEKETHFDYDTNYESKEKTFDIDSIWDEEETVSCYELDIDFDSFYEDKHDSSDYVKSITNTDKSESEEISINDEFDMFQEELRIREKRLKNFVSFSVDEELYKLIDELNGIS